MPLNKDTKPNLNNLQKIDTPLSKETKPKPIIYLSSNISFTESDAKICIGKVWIVIDRLSNIWKADLSDKIKLKFFQAVAMSVLLYGCTTWILTKCLVKKLNRNYTRMLHTILYKSWKQDLE